MADKRKLGDKMKAIGFKSLVVSLGLAVLQLFPSCFAVLDSISKYCETNVLLEASYNGTVIRDLRYGDGEREVYDLYLPEDTSDPKATHLVLFIHGGAWYAGDKKEGEYWCRNLSSKGYTTASISYTLKSLTTDTNIPLINNQVDEAVKAIKAKCAEEGIILVDMATNGFSAGACQAMLYAWDTADADAGLPVRFIIQQSGPTTMDPEVWRNGEIHPFMLKFTGLDGSVKNDAKWISQVSGETVTVDMVRDGSADAYWKKVSPYTYITDSSVPVVFAYGTMDGVVPPESRIVLEKALIEHHVPHVSIIMENSGHVLACDLDRYREFLDYVDKFCAKYFMGEEITID